MIKFRNTDHQERFDRAAADLGFPFGLPADWAACLFILTADEWTWKAVVRHVNLEAREIFWTKIRRLDFGRGIEFLMQLAQYLYNGTGKIDLERLWETLDDSNFALAMSAIQVRRRGRSVIGEAA